MDGDELRIKLPAEEEIHKSVVLNRETESADLGMLSSK